MTHSCTVIVPTYNRLDTLLACLDRLAAQTVGPEHLQVVVVDDGSTDDTVSLLSALPYPFGEFVVRSQRNAGPGAARNKGLAVATAPVTLFINDDTLLAPDAVAVHLDVHAREPHRMVMGTFDFSPYFAVTPLGRLLGETTHLFSFGLLQPGDECSAMLAATCNLSVPTGPAQAIGFDEGFRRPAGEDVAFAVELERAGLSLVYRPEARSWHDHWMTVQGLKRTVLTRGEGNGRFTALYQPIEQILKQYRLAAERSDGIHRLLDQATDRLEARLEALEPNHTGPFPEPVYEDLETMFRLGATLGGLQDDALLALL